MSCPLETESSFDVLLDYSAGRLDPARSALIERHAMQCAECSVFLAGQGEVWSSLGVWEPEPVSMDFNRGVWRRIEEDAANTPWYRKLGEALRAGMWKPAVPLAAAVLLVSAGFMMDHQPSRVTVVAQAGVTEDFEGGVSMLEADQVEKALDDLQLVSQLGDSVGDAEQTNPPTM